jgi:uncharacterized membrane protein
MIMNIHSMTRNAMIATLYIVFTLVPPLNSLSFLAIQFRVSEALLILVWFRKDYVIGLVIGTFVANFFGPLGGGFSLLDAILGSLVSMLALQIMISIKPRSVGLIAPMMLNALYLALFLPFALSIEPSAWIGFASLTFFTVALGEAAVLILLGLPLVFVIQSQPRLRQLIQGEAQ